MTSPVKPMPAQEKCQSRHIFYVTDTHSPANFGVTAILNQYAAYFRRQGWPITVLTAGAAGTPVPPGVELREFPLFPGGRSWHYSAKLAAYLQGLNQGSGAIFHLHGVWGAPQWLAARTAVRRGLPAIMTTHDMLSPWHWRYGRLRRWKKLLYWRTLAYPAFRYLTLIHVNTIQERDALAHLFPGQRLEVIPNAIDLHEVDELISEAASAPSPEIEGPYLLFLGCLHPQKGVDLLISAFAQASKGRGFRLVLVGPDTSSAYASSLKALVRSWGVESEVDFLGPIFGLRKWRLIQEAWACCLPSRSEGMSQVSLEVAAAGVPLLTTHEAKIADWQEGGGIMVHPRVEEVAGALERVISWTEQERQDRGRRLRQLVERQFSWEVVGPQWLRLYNQLLEQSG